MTEHDEQSDPMAMVDLALTFSAPVISVRNSFLEAGMGTELTDHIVRDFAHYLLTIMTFQAMNDTDTEHAHIDGASG